MSSSTVAECTSPESPLEEIPQTIVDPVRQKEPWTRWLTLAGGVVLIAGCVLWAVIRLLKGCRTPRSRPRPSSNAASRWHGWGRTDQAIEAIRAASQLRPNDAEAHFTLGIALASEHKLDSGGPRIPARSSGSGPGTGRLTASSASPWPSLERSTRPSHNSTRPFGWIPASPRLTTGWVSPSIRRRSSTKPSSRNARPHQAFQGLVTPRPIVRPGRALARGGRSSMTRSQAYRQAARSSSLYGVLSRDDLGDAPKEQKKLDEAVAAYRHAIRLEPKLAGSRTFCLGIALSIQGKLDESIAALRESTRLRPDVAAGHFSLGCVLEAQGKLDEAKAAYDEAKRLNSELVGRPRSASRRCERDRRGQHSQRPSA